MKGLACPAGTCISLLPAVFFLLCWVETCQFSPLLSPVARLRILESKRPYNPLKPVFFFFFFFKPWGKGGPKRKTHTARERGARGRRSLAHVRVCPLFHGSGADPMRGQERKGSAAGVGDGFPALGTAHPELALCLFGLSGSGRSAHCNCSSRGQNYQSLNPPSLTAGLIKKGGVCPVPSLLHPCPCRHCGLPVQGAEAEPPRRLPESISGRSDKQICQFKFI